MSTGATEKSEWTARDILGSFLGSGLFIDEDDYDEADHVIATLTENGYHIVSAAVPLFVRCPDCGGRGIIREYEQGPNAWSVGQCATCNGARFVSLEGAGKQSPGLTDAERAAMGDIAEMWTLGDPVALSETITKHIDVISALASRP